MILSRSLSLRREVGDQGALVDRAGAQFHPRMRDLLLVEVRVLLCRGKVFLDLHQAGVQPVCRVWRLFVSIVIRKDISRGIAPHPERDNRGAILVGRRAI